MKYQPLLERDPDNQLTNQTTVKMNWFDAILVPVLVLSIIGLSFVPATATVTDVNSTTVTQQVNQQRLAHGLKPLVVDVQLQQAAVAKAEDMVRRGYFAHYYENETPWDYINRTGDTDWRVAGENLAKNYDSSVVMVQAWMNSQKHRENILRAEYAKTGVAVVKTTLANGEAVTVTVQLFTGA